MGVGASTRRIFMLTPCSAAKGFKDKLGEYTSLLPHQSISPFVAIVAASQPKARPQTGPQWTQQQPGGHGRAFRGQMLARRRYLLQQAEQPGALGGTAAHMLEPRMGVG